MLNETATLNRRSVLQGLFAAAAVAMSPRSAFADEGGKRIGFVDDSLDNFHSNVYLQILRKELKDRGYTVAGAFALQAEKSRAWADKQGVPYFESVEKLNAAVDCFAILAPGTPGTHWELCQKVFPFGKTTFVDKTFAPDAATGQKIFDLADQHKVAVQTSSALRYTAVQQHADKVGRTAIRHMIAWGGGSSFDEYIIHPLEMAVSCLGPEVESLHRRGTGPDTQLLLNFSRERTAVVNLFSKARTPFAASLTTDKGTDYVEVDNQKLFVAAAAGMLDFFAAGKPLVDRQETLAILRIIDAARDPAARQGFVKL